MCGKKIVNNGESFKVCKYTVAWLYCFGGYYGYDIKLSFLRFVEFYTRDEFEWL